MSACAARKLLRALPAPESEEDKETVVICGISYIQRKVEPAGHAFHDAHEKPLLEGKRKGKKPEARDVSDDEGADDSKWRSKHKSKDKEKDKKPSGSLKLSVNLEGVDLYKLFEVSEGATTEEIKKQYRKLALQHHPDKHKAEGASDTASTPSDVKGLTEQDLIFVRIQEAYEILADQSKRRQYDSTLDFDESFPEEVDEAIGFYATFQPVFHRNARWSTRRPVPDLGSESTPIEKVHKFYDWWFEFESWRDFSQHAEFNLEDAEFREERRWMERQNQKVLKKYEQDERKRIMRIAEVAERLDPRIRAEKEEKEAKKREEKERRARLKQEEEDAKRREEEEKKNREEREKAEKEEKEKQEREQRKQKNQTMKSLRQRLKKSLQGHCKLNASEMEELQEFALGFEEPEPLEALCVRFEASKPSALEAVVREELDKWKRRNASEKEEEVRQREEAKKNEERKAKEAKEAAVAAASGATWSVEEMGILAKGLQKFPGGVGGRWSLITQLLNTSGFNRTEQEVVAKTKEMSDGKSLRAMGSMLDSSFQTPNAKAPATKAKAKAEPATSAPSKAASKSAPEKPAPAAEVEAPASSEWSAEQQKKLEAALQKHPATLDKNERWRLIAEEVPGKSKAQCVERFKFIREQMKQGKS